jgi:cytochrome c oxidase cbb3-type subunit III
VLSRTLLSAALLAAAACRGPEPPRALPPSGEAGEGASLRTSDLSAGGGARDVAVVNPYADDPVARAEGRALYASMNCAGCHGPAGGGGIGPPLADTDWIYGGQPENVVETVLQGRPNGMPAFGARLPRAEAWKLAAYVLTLAPADTGRKSPAVGGAR